MYRRAKWLVIGLVLGWCLPAIAQVLLPSSEIYYPTAVNLSDTDWVLAMQPTKSTSPKTSRITLPVLRTYITAGGTNTINGLQEFQDDVAASIGGLKLNQMYRNGSVLLICITCPAS